SNYGYWEHNSGQVDLEPASQLKNEAVIYDLGGAFDAIIANTSFGNDGVIINRQNYMPVAGQTYSNVFHLGGTSWGYIGSNWSISPNIIWSFATYDFGNNSLTFNNILPYQINQLYAEVGIDGCSSRTYRIPFAGAPNRPENPLSDPNTAHVDLTQPETTVFPNPIQSDFQLRFSSALEAPALIQLFDMSGRQLAQWAAAAEIGQMQLNRPANTPFGIYMLSILHANGEVEQQRLVFE
ncbi:MAG: T9SS type A sorting domain-containing protein, partial [Bacteroidota bacterium]